MEHEKLEVMVWKKWFQKYPNNHIKNRSDIFLQAKTSRIAVLYRRIESLVHGQVWVQGKSIVYL